MESVRCRLRQPNNVKQPNGRVSLLPFMDLELIVTPSDLDLLKTSNRSIEFSKEFTNIYQHQSHWLLLVPYNMSAIANPSLIFSS